MLGPEHCIRYVKTQNKKLPPVGIEHGISHLRGEYASGLTFRPLSYLHAHCYHTYSVFPHKLDH
jgi:hypothetical protein